VSGSHRQLGVVLQWLFTDGRLAEGRAEERARMLLLDTIGCIAAGLTAPPVRQFGEALALGAPGEIVAGAGLTLAPAATAQLWATAATWDEACEGLARAHGRPGVPVVAASLALALARDLTLGELLEAIVVGYEVGGRMGEWLRIRPGMHVDAGWPALGVAAAAARIAGGSAHDALAAVQTAACQLGLGLYAPVAAGATARNTYLAHAASLGLLAAAAAAGGIDAPETALDDYARIALGLDPAAARLAPAGELLIEQGYLKPYAAVRHVHYGVEAALALRERVFARLDAIERIELAVYPEALQYCGNRAPRTPIAAQFSLSFGVAAALRFGDLSPAVYRAPMFDEPGLRKLEWLVDPQADPALGEGGKRAARLTLHLPSARLEHTIASVKGDADAPFTQHDCEAKFVAYARERAGEARAHAAAEAILDGSLDQSVRALWQALNARDYEVTIGKKR
jgi:2-methylcitrate dehydratase PrpD